MTTPTVERRQDHRDWYERVGHKVIGNTHAWAGAILLHFVLLAFVAGGVLLLNQSAHTQIHKLRLEVEQQTGIAGDSKLTADIIRECFLAPDLSKCPIPSTTTTTTR